MFKFYHIPDLATIKKIIGNQPKLKFKSASELNDPFEFKFNLSNDPNNPAHKEAFFQERKDATERDFESWKENDMTWYLAQERRNDLAQIVTLCCFTEKNNSNLMWSHYSNNHTGICVQYHDTLIRNIRNDKRFFACEKITYSDIPPLIDTMEDKKAQLFKMLFHKQSEWKYEQEKRIILVSRNNEDFPIKTSDIKAVYMGSKIDTVLEKRIIEICEYNKYECYHGITLGDSYFVNFEKHLKDRIYMKAMW